MQQQMKVTFIFQISAGADAVKIARYVQQSANHTSFFGHELQDVMEILKSTFELHMRQVVWEYPAIRLNKSAIFTSSATGIVDKLLVAKLGLQQLVEVSGSRILSFAGNTSETSFSIYYLFEIVLRNILQ
jgi:hypothetical protein